MRVLVTCVPQAGHVTPLLPLAEALARRGEDVLVASGCDVGETVTGRGLPFRAVGPSFAEWFATLAGRTRGQPGDGLPPERVEHYFVPRLFGEVGAALVLDDLLAAARDHRPDLVVFDSAMVAGPMVAAALGVPGVFHAVGVLHDPEVLELVADAVSPLWRELGLDAPRDAGLHTGTTITICPPSLDPGAAELSQVQPLRPTALPQPGPVPGLIDGLPPAPLVYLTLGTFSNSNLEVFHMLVEALAGLPVNVVATVGRDNDPASFGALPDNVRMARFVPQAELLPHCDLVVHHAGAGTAFGALAHGLPSVAVPQSADNFQIGRRLARAGAARVVMPDEASVTSVREAVAEVLDDHRYAASARQVAAEIAAMPTADEVATVLADGPR